jgi:peptide/nickel transport system ATP-binding protein
MLAVVGESGSGKSTLGYALLNIVPKPGRVVKGRVLLGDIDVLKLSPEELRRVRGSRISLVFQDPFTTLDPLRKIGDQFAEFLMEHGLDKASAYRTAREYTEAVGIPGRVLDSHPHQLSGGRSRGRS